jgi:translation initiation factor 3 subunit C
MVYFSFFVEVKVMSRFFAAGSDSDSSLSDQESHKSSDEEQQSKTKKHSMWLKKDSDSDSEEEAKKVVRSQSDKRTDELRAKAKSLANALNIQDWVQAHVEFDALQKLNSKHFTQMPRFYVRALVELNAAIADVPSKKMNKSTNKAYGVVSQKIKKLFKSHQVEIKTFVDNPVNEEDSADEAEELAAKELEEKTLLPKKVTEPDADMMNTDDFIVVGASKSSVAEVYTSHRIFKTLDEILLARGKKSTDKSSQITQLSSLLLKSSTPYQKLKIFLALISARFDLQFSTPSLEMWASSCNEIAMVFQILEENEHIIIKDMPIDDTIPENIVDSKSVLGELTIISGSITSYIDLLEDEFNKSLLSIDCHTLDYIERLKDEIKVYGLLVKTEKYARKVGCDVTVIDLLMMKRVEHLYYKVYYF